MHCCEEKVFVGSGLETTLMIIKPDAVEDGHMGAILDRAERNGFRILAMQMLRWSAQDASVFYAMHKGKPFFDGLIEFMSSGSIVWAVVERADAINYLRALAGPTDSRQASPGTIRGDFGTDERRNAVHASDSPESAKREIAFLSGDRKKESVKANFDLH